MPDKSAMSSSAASVAFSVSAQHPKGDDEMDDQLQSSTLDVEHYFHVLRRQWRLIVAVTTLGILLAAGYLVFAPREYTATTTLNLTVISTEPFAARSAPSSLLDDQEERAIAQSHVVATRAADLLEGGLSASEIRAASSVSSSSGPTIVAVNFTANSAEEAASGADAVASAYLSYRSERAGERVASLVGGLETRIDGLESQVSTLDGQMTSVAPESADYARSTSERQQILTELDDLRAERNGLQSVDTTAGFVLSSAADNAVYAAPSKKLALFTGTAAGLVLGIIAAFVRNPSDRRLRDTGEIARALSAPVFSLTGGDADDVPVPARGESADALRVARERMLVDVVPGDTVLVVDASHAAELSGSALNLALVTAQSGYDVQVITPETPGRTRRRLSAVLDAGEDRAILPSSGGALRFFSVQDARDDRQSDLLVTRDTSRAIAEAGARTITFLVLTVEAYPASLLAGLRASQSVVLVAREKATTTSEIAWLRCEAKGIGVPILGAVLEEARHESSPEGKRAMSRAERRSTVRRQQEAVSTQEPVSVS